MEDVSTFVKLKNLELKKKKETERRERLKLMNSARKLERENIFIDLENQVQDAVKYIQIDEKNAVPVIYLQDLVAIFEKNKKFVKKSRKFC